MTAKKRQQIIDAVAAGESQHSVARRFRLSQQMVSKIWQAATGARKGKHGGKRRGPQYDRIRASRAQQINNQRKDA